jgi:type I restriction enzyme M protein
VYVADFVDDIPQQITVDHPVDRAFENRGDDVAAVAAVHTPRPVVRFMVEVIDPKLGEVILDPACGTGGFLLESFKHLEKQCKTVEDRLVLQNESIFGGEAKPLPYLLAQMNLVLHGLESPKIDPLNSLRFPLREIGDRDRVDILMTNPPFGGEEERGILGNFPEDKQTSETALLFLQLIMRKLKRPGSPSPSGRGRGEGNLTGGRAAVVVPNGTLSAPGIAMRIRAELLQDFNLHAIVRLPHNVFSPYTDIKTNVLFFDRNGPTTVILYCAPPLPSGVSLSKTKPLQYEWLSPYIEAISEKRKDEYCWTVNVASLDDSLNLDLKNPQLLLSLHEAADGCLDTLASGYRNLSDGVQRLRDDVAAVTKLLRVAPIQLLGNVTDESDERIGTGYHETIRLLGVSNIEGFCDPKGPIGKHPERYKVVREGYLAYNPMRINIGSIGVALCDGHVGITSPDYVVFKCHHGLLPEYVYHYLRSEAGQHQINQKTKGSVRFRLYYEQLAEIPIPVPEDETLQQRFAELCRRIEIAKQQSLEFAGQADRALDAVRPEAFLHEYLGNTEE